MTNRLSGKVAVVTGGSAGIGLGTAKAFAAEGAQVFITGRTASTLEAAKTAIGGNTIVIQGDTSNLADIDRIYKVVKRTAGHIDVLFVNAGFYEFSALGEITEEHFDKTFNINVRGLLFAVQKALPLMSAGSSIILNGSIASGIGIPSFSVYAATKAAVRAFARSWILDLKGRGIRVNVLRPGHTDTPGLNAVLDEPTKNHLISTIPLGRIGTADDLAKAALFLATEESAYVTGIEFTVDGGVAQY
jgi:NAD(P)-dependent dehydrogenase (short-subunit alcohol dehydrogenase family)